MKKALALFSRKKACRPFKDYYAQWIHALNSNLIPLLRRAMLSSSPSNLSTHVEMVHHHFQAYYGPRRLQGCCTTALPRMA
eukprot:XP_019082161.1 PREDICTED: protein INAPERTURATE POLLEN1 isoform X2 [Vitis vinifera]